MKPFNLVLLPGLDGTGIFLQPLLAALPATIRPLVVAYPASGPTRYTDLLPIIREAVAPLSEFHLLGWSFSGPLALRRHRHVDVARRAACSAVAAEAARRPVPAGEDADLARALGTHAGEAHARSHAGRRARGAALLPTAGDVSRRQPGQRCAAALPRRDPARAAVG